MDLSSYSFSSCGDGDGDGGALQLSDMMEEFGSDGSNGMIANAVHSSFSSSSSSSLNSSSTFSCSSNGNNNGPPALSNSLQSQFSFNEAENLSSSNGKRMQIETNQDKLSKGIPRFKLFPNGTSKAPTSTQGMISLSNSRSAPSNMASSMSSSRSIASSYGQGHVARSFNMHSAAATIPSDLPANIDKMKSFFDQSITLNPDSIQPIVGAMNRSKGTDNKEKQRRLEVAVDQLHKLLVNLIGEVMQVRTQCILHEHNQNQMIRNQWRELSDYNRKNDTMAESDTKYKVEIQRLKQEGDAMKTKIADYSNEKSRLQNLISSFEHRKLEVIEKQKREEILKQETHNKISEMEKVWMDARMEASHAINQAREVAEQRFETNQEAIFEEIQELRQEISRRQKEAEKFLEERSSFDHKLSHLRQELVRFESCLREAEHTSSHYDREIQRLETDLKMSKELILQKDKDISSTLMDSSDVERQCNDERSTLKAETDDLKSKLMLLEEERDRITDELNLEEESSASLKSELLKMGEYSKTLIRCIEDNSPSLGQIEGLNAQIKLELEAKEKIEWAENEARKEKSVFCDNTLAVRNDTECKLKESESRLAKDFEELKQQVVSVGVQNDELKMEIDKQSSELNVLKAECIKLNQDLDKDKTKNREVIQKTSDAKKEVLLLKKRIRDVQDQEIEDAEAVKSKIIDFEKLIQEGESKRRKLHNEIQELRGNIRVFARVRPFLPSDLVSSAGSNPTESTIETKMDGSSLAISRRISPTEMGEEYDFNYDRVFGQSTTQETIFNEVSEFVQSALDGYNVCLFSYGQTGSGKTHTMQGIGNGDHRGIVPRAMEQVGRYKSELERQGWIYTMEVSFIEIYNETIKDLLRNSHKDDVKHEIRHDKNNKPYVADIQMIAVDPNNVDQIQRITDLASKHRSVGQTAMNERSSRSHSVFTLHLTAKNEHQGINLKGTLSLVDLAGSERIDKSGVTGERLRETQNINSSLSALSDVFVSLGTKSKHVPYRNSKLTHILQPALSGDGKTLMFVNLSPTNDSYSESLSSLKFAKLVNRCELGKAVKQLEASAPSSLSSSSLSSATSSTLVAAKENKENSMSASNGIPTPSKKIGGASASTSTAAPEKSSFSQSRGVPTSNLSSSSASSSSNNTTKSNNMSSSQGSAKVLGMKQPVSMARKLK